MQAQILTIGDELLIGQVLNTNAAWLGEQLSLTGIHVRSIVSVGDDAKAIRKAIESAYAESDILIVTGGLGPTHDDVTKSALADFLNADMYLHEEIMDHVRERFSRRQVPMPENNRSQAMVPRGCIPILNPAGTAPGLWFESSRDGKRKVIALLPGVPHEMRALMEIEVIPRLQRRDDREVILYKNLLTVGVGESRLAEMMGDLESWLSQALRLAFLPRPAGVLLRITATGDDEESLRNRLEAFESHLRDRLGDVIYGEGADELEVVIGRLLEELDLTISVAESCTGGHVLDRLTDVAGSSTYVFGGMIAYCNDVKIRFLGVDPDILDTAGAVSESVACAMARGVRERLDTSIGVSTTGIAGPTGGTDDKPVGTVWIGYSDRSKTYAIKLQLVSDRLLNKQFTATALFDLLRRELQIRRTGNCEL